MSSSSIVLQRSCSYCGAALELEASRVVRCAYCGGESELGPPVGLPAPHAISTFDHIDHLVHLSVIVTGDEPGATLRRVAATSQAISTMRLVTWPDGTVGEAYLRMKLGEVRGYGIRVHLFAIPPELSPWRDPHFAAHVTHCHGVLVSSAVEAAAMSGLLSWIGDGLRSRSVQVPVGLIGTEGIGRRWAEEVAYPVVYQGAEPREAVQEIARQALRRLAQS